MNYILYKQYNQQDIRESTIYELSYFKVHFSNMSFVLASHAPPVIASFYSYFLSRRVYVRMKLAKKRKQLRRHAEKLFLVMKKTPKNKKSGLLGNTSHVLLFNNFFLRNLQFAFRPYMICQSYINITFIESYFIKLY